MEGKKAYGFQLFWKKNPKHLWMLAQTLRVFDVQEEEWVVRACPWSTFLSYPWFAKESILHPPGGRSYTLYSQRNNEIAKWEDFQWRDKDRL